MQGFPLCNIWACLTPPPPRHNTHIHQNVPPGALRQGALTPRVGYIACIRGRCNLRVRNLPIGCVRHHTYTRSAVSDLHCYVCRELCPCRGTHMWHDCVAVAVAVSAGWRALADLLEAQWLLLDSVQQQGAPNGVVWRLVHPDLPFDPLSVHPDVVLLSRQGVVVVRDGA